MNRILASLRRNIWLVIGCIGTPLACYRMFVAHDGNQRLDAFGACLLALAALAIGVIPVLPENRFTKLQAGLALLILPCIILGLLLELKSEFSYSALWQRAVPLYLRLQKFFGPGFPLAETTLLTLLGYGLFRLKVKSLITYAYIELAFAVTSCYIAIDRSQQELSTGAFLVLSAAVYLVVRGLDNQKKAREANPT